MALKRNWLPQWLVPELVLLDSVKDQRAVYKSAVRGLGTKYSLAAFVLPLAAQIPYRLVIVRLNLGMVFESLLFGLLVAGLTILGIWFFRRELRSRVRSSLNERGMHVCMGCAYQRAGLTEPRCPECGQPFERSDKSSLNTPDIVASPPRQ